LLEILNQELFSELGARTIFAWNLAKASSVTTLVVASHAVARSRTVQKSHAHTDMRFNVLRSKMFRAKTSLRLHSQQNLEGRFGL